MPSDRSNRFERKLILAPALVIGLGLVGFQATAWAGVRSSIDVEALPSFADGTKASGVIVVADNDDKKHHKKGKHGKDDGDNNGNHDGNGGDGNDHRDGGKNGNWAKDGDWGDRDGGGGNGHRNGGNNADWDNDHGGSDWGDHEGGGDWDRNGYKNWSKKNGKNYGKGWSNYNNNWNKNWNKHAYVRNWNHRPYYGEFIGGVVLGSILAANGVGVVPYAPEPYLCWYWADPYMYRGYWDYCD